MAEHRYKGILAERIVKPTLITSTPDRENNFNEQLSAALDALLDDLKIKPAIGKEIPWKDLALALAERHVPAFGARRPGRPSKIVAENFRLFLLVELLICRDGVAERSALKTIYETGEFAVRFETLRSRLKDIRRHALFVQMKNMLDKIESDRGKDALIRVLHASTRTD